MYSTSGSQLASSVAKKGIGPATVPIPTGRARITRDLHEVEEEAVQEVVAVAERPGHEDGADEADEDMVSGYPRIIQAIPAMYTTSI
jgi:hypothetical protein